MGEYNGFENDDFDDEFDGYGTQGNDALKQARRAARENAKLVKELKSQMEEQAKELATFKTKVHQSTVADILKAKGANPQLARWLAKDDVEASDEAVTKWLSENGDLFGFKPGGNTGTDEADGSTGEGSDGDGVDDDVLAAMQRMQDSEASATPSLAITRKLDQQITDIGKSAQSFDDVVAGLKKSGLI